MLMKTKEEICCSVNKIPRFAMEKDVAKAVDDYIDTVLHYCSTKELLQTFAAEGNKILPDLKAKKHKRAAAHLEKAVREVNDCLKFYYSERTGNSRRQRKTRRLLSIRVDRGRLSAHPQVG